MQDNKPTKPGELSIDEQLKALDLEERKEALEARKLQNELNRLQLADLRAQNETKVNNKKRGAADAKKAMEDRKAEQARCNHHLGGEGALAVVYGQGDEERPTCISGIQFTDKSIRLRCGRCGKPWCSKYPNGNDEFGPWAEGVALFRKSLFKMIAIVGGVVVEKQPQVAA